MNNLDENNLVGTFLIEEHDGKKYKMLVVEEIPEEWTAEQIVQEVSDILGVQVFDACRLECASALMLINFAISKENELDRTNGPYKYWWVLNDKNEVHSVDMKNEYADGHKFFHPYQEAKSRQVIRKVVNKLGVDIFKVACGKL